MNGRSLIGVLVLLAAAASSTIAQQRPPIRQLGAITAKSTERVMNVVNARALSSGAILVNDMPARRVLLFDPQLSSFTVVADSTGATGNAYGGRFGSLLAYRGDSSIFADPASVSMLIIDPAGKIARVVAIPRAEDANAIGTPTGNASFDPAGRIIYRQTGFRFGGAPGGRTIRGADGGTAGAGGAGFPRLPEPPDSAFILRVDLATRKVDTVGVIRTPKVTFTMSTDDRGRMSISSMINPLPTVDDWTVTPDGAIAFVRGRDYHVEWVNPDGTKVSAAKIPFDWKRMTDEDKVAFIDSVKAARERQGASAPGPFAGALGGGGGGAPNVQININPGGAGGGPGGGRRPDAPQTTVAFIPPGELPDYQPPFFAGSVRADNDGNVWIRTIPTTAIAGGPVYDVINRKGDLVDRVQIPVGRTIIGFGPNRAVYLVNREGATATLEKASIR